VGFQCKQHSGDHSVVRFEDLVFFLLGVVKFNCAVHNVDRVPAAVIDLELVLNHFLDQEASVEPFSGGVCEVAR
jgi:hypothetical protein